MSSGSTRADSARAQSLDGDDIQTGEDRRREPSKRNSRKSEGSSREGSVGEEPGLLRKVLGGIFSPRQGKSPDTPQSADTPRGFG